MPYFYWDLPNITLWQLAPSRSAAEENVRMNLIFSEYRSFKSDYFGYISIGPRPHSDYIMNMIRNTNPKVIFLNNI